jgi:hypothetical protein
MINSPPICKMAISRAWQTGDRTRGTNLSFRAISQMQKRSRRQPVFLSSNDSAVPRSRSFSGAAAAQVLRSLVDCRCHARGASPRTITPTSLSQLFEAARSGEALPNSTSEGVYVLARFSITLSRHCEERSDEAIQKIVGAGGWLDCFASLAMTVASRFDRKPL